MTEISLDDLDWALLAEVQQDGRASITQLAKKISLSVSATSERLRRLEESGVIIGYTAVVDVDKLGYQILAQLRLRYPSSRYQPLHDLLAKTPEVIEAHHVTGEDCFVLKVIATSMRHLEEISGRIGGLGSVTTSVAYSSPLERRAIGRPALTTKQSPAKQAPAKQSPAKQSPAKPAPAKQASAKQAPAKQASRSMSSREPGSPPDPTAGRMRTR